MRVGGVERVPDSTLRITRAVKSSRGARPTGVTPIDSFAAEPSPYLIPKTARG
jgi:hypothetical protein